MTYSIKIYDSKGTYIGVNPTASAQDIITGINKGFVIKDANTGKAYTIEDISVGVSDGFINVG